MSEERDRPADRPERAHELEALRRERAEQLAIQTALTNERIMTRLSLLEDHKKTVNGQIGRLAEAQEEMNNHLQEIREEMRIAKKVSEALVKNTESVGAARLGHWQMWALLIGAIVGIATVALLLIQTLHGLAH